MRTSREHTAATRSRIVDTASRRFRERGINGIGVSELMAGAGLTHGGFYKHFDSKEELAALACAHALAQTRAELGSTVAAAPDADAMKALVDSYLTPAHSASPGRGCTIAALGPEATRGDGALKDALAKGVALLLDLIGEQLHRSGVDDAAAKRTGVLAALVGGLVLARAMPTAVASRKVLRDTRTFIIAAL